MIRVGVLGGRGYVGGELFTVLSGIPEFEIVYVGSRSKAGQMCEPVGLSYTDMSAESISNCDADVWVIAQSNGVAKDFVEIIADKKILDISADFRFDDTWEYGLPEFNNSLHHATRVSNPGCYATAMQLALLPLRQSVVGQPVGFGVSGYSGAGKTPNANNDPDHLRDNLVGYKLSGHIHELEVSRTMGFDVQFSPHVASFFRGIHVTVKVEIDHPIDASTLREMFATYYAHHPLVKVTDAIPELRMVQNENFAIVGGFAVDARHPTRVTIVSVIDNLRKGAASQAIQNLNLMFGRSSTEGLV